MKKKIISLCLVVALGATAVIGGTLAYFTDVDKEINTFTVGNISIDLQENFTQESKLMPGIDVTKEVWIENDGDNDAYVWYEWLIPAALDSTDGSTGTNNVLHVNSFGRTWDAYRENNKYWAEGQETALPLEQTWDHDPEIELANELGPQGFAGEVEIDGVKYNKYVTLYHGVVSAKKDGVNGKTTSAMSKVYLDPKVDCIDGEYYIVADGVATPVNFDVADTQIIVHAYGIQAQGFDTVYEAYQAYQAQY